MFSFVPFGLSTGVATPTATAPLTPNEVLFYLGYRNYQHNRQLTDQVKKNLEAFELTRIQEIVSRLKEVDAAISEASNTSNVSKTCKTEMNWRLHLRTLREEGRTLLLEFSRIFDVDIAASKYTRQRPKGHTKQYQ